jgi:hypothetical protein
LGHDAIRAPADVHRDVRAGRVERSSTNPQAVERMGAGRRLHAVVVEVEGERRASLAHDFHDGTAAAARVMCLDAPPLTSGARVGVVIGGSRRTDMGRTGRGRRAGGVGDGDGDGEQAGDGERSAHRGGVYP